MKKYKDQSKRSVLYIIDDFHIGGVTSFIKNYTEVLTENNYAVTILGFSGNLTNPISYFKKCNVVVIPKKLAFSKIGRLQNFLAFLSALHNVYHKQKNIEYIHFSTTWSTLYAIAHPLTWSKKRIITFYGAYDLERESMGEQHFLKQKLRHLLQYISLRQCHQIITFSTYARTLIRTHFNKELSKKTHIIPGYYNSARSSYTQQKKATTKKLVIANFGRAEPRKGLDLLLEAVRIFIDRGHKIKVFIASPVSYFYEHPFLLQQYEKLNLGESVQFLHALDDVQKNKLLRTVDVFVMPSRNLETFGITILEALSQGTVVIGTKAGAIPEILSTIDERLITKKITAKSIADRLEWFSMLSLKERRILKQKAQRVLAEKFSKKQCAQKLLRVYESI